MWGKKSMNVAVILLAFNLSQSWNLSLILSLWLLCSLSASTMICHLITKFMYRCVWSWRNHMGYSFRFLSVIPPDSSKQLLSAAGLVTCTTSGFFYLSLCVCIKSECIPSVHGEACVCVCVQPCPIEIDWSHGVMVTSSCSPASPPPLAFLHFFYIM